MKTLIRVLICFGIVFILAGCNGSYNPTASSPIGDRQSQTNSPTTLSDDTENSDILLHPYKHYNIVAVGDSITYGIGVFWTDSYPRVLERKLRDAGYDITMNNAGIPGAYSYEIDDIFESLVSGADVALIMIGANDAVCSTCTPKVHIRSMIQKSFSLGVTPVLSTVTPKRQGGSLEWANPMVNGINAQIRELAQEYNVKLVDNYTAILQNGGDALFSDAHHFNIQGYDVIATEWYTTLRGIFAMPR